eukprot:scaffold1993_cov107-Cylindrotheca_fusiformis.AAC.7
MICPIHAHRNAKDGPKWMDRLENWLADIMALYSYGVPVLVTTPRCRGKIVFLLSAACQQNGATPNKNDVSCLGACSSITAMIA